MGHLAVGQGMNVGDVTRPDGMRMHGTAGGSDAPARRVLFERGTVVTPLQVLRDGALYVERGVIRAVGQIPELDRFRAEADRIVDCSGRYIVPGFIDVHVHGGGGGDTMAASVEALRTMARFHARGGTTALVATTVSADEGAIARALAAIRRARDEGEWPGAAILGAHLEGPFIAPEQAGAQNPGAIRAPSPADLDRLSDWAEIVRVITAAPEIEGGLEVGRKAAALGIVASMGHSNALYPDVVRGVAAGYRSVTHLYCGMSKWVNVRGEKMAGLAESALLIDELFVELIADGNHVPPHLIQLTYKVKGADRVCLVTDSIWAAGLPPGPYQLGGVDIVVTPTSARMADGSGNAGSVATMDMNLRNVVQLAGIGLADAIRSATWTPANLLAIHNKKGVLAPGKDADVVVLDEDLRVRLTMVAGRIVFEAGGKARHA